MNGIMKLELPVHFDSMNDAIVDSRGRTIAIMSWPNCGLDVLTVKDRAMFIANALNSTGNGVFSNSDTKLPETSSTVKKTPNPLQETASSGLVQSVKNMFKGKRFDKRKRKFKLVDEQGNDWHAKSRKGLKRVYI